MSTEEWHVVLLDEARSLVFAGSDRRLSTIILRAPAEELLAIGAALPAEALHLTAGEALNAGRPAITIRRRAWTGLRMLLRDRWGVDIADQSVAYRVEQKYAIDVNSPAGELLHALWAEAADEPALAAARSEKPSHTEIYLDDAAAKRKPGRRRRTIKRPTLVHDYYGWPAHVWTAVWAQLDAAAPRFRAALAANPEAWRVPVSPYDRYTTNSLFAQALASDYGAEEPNPRYWTRDWLDRADPRSSYGQHEPLIPGGDPAFAAYPDHEVKFSAPAVTVRLNGSGALLLRQAQARAERAVAAKQNQLGIDSVAPTLDEQAELDEHFARYGRSRRADEPLVARTYLVVPERRLAFLMLTATEASGDVAGAGVNVRAWRYVSPAVSLPEGAAPNDLVVLNSLTFEIERETPGSRLQEVSFVSPWVGANLDLLGRLLWTDDLRYEAGDPDTIEPTIALFEVETFEPRAFTPAPERAAEILSLVFANAALRADWPHDKPDAAAKAVLAAWPEERWQASWELDEAEPAFTFRAFVPGTSLEISRHIPVRLDPESSRVAALRDVERWAANHHASALADELLALLKAQPSQA